MAPSGSRRGHDHCDDKPRCFPPSLELTPEQAGTLEAFAMRGDPDSDPLTGAELGAAGTDKEGILGSTHLRWSYGPGT